MSYEDSVLYSLSLSVLSLVLWFAHANRDSQLAAWCSARAPSAGDLVRGLLLSESGAGSTLGHWRHQDDTPEGDWSDQHREALRTEVVDGVRILCWEDQRSL